MKTASDVTELVAKWIASGKDKSYIIINAAEACIGWPYVWGAVGAECNPDKRWYYAHRDVCPEGEKKQILRTCQYYNEDGTKTGKGCGGCQFYPDNMRTICNDCQGFCKYLFLFIAITLPGAGCTSMWNASGFWAEKGTIDKMPKDRVCLVFQRDPTDSSKMQHMGVHIGNGNIVECSGTVKRSTTANKHWTHYAIPKGMDGKVPPEVNYPTLRKGSSGEYVTLLQTKLIQRGYNVGATGADGKYGTNTFNAVKQFQNDNGLSVDGICGRATWGAILDGQTELYTVTIQHVSKSVADSIVSKYGGTMKKE